MEPCGPWRAFHTQGYTTEDDEDEDEGNYYEDYSEDEDEDEDEDGWRIVRGRRVRSKAGVVQRSMPVA